MLEDTELMAGIQQYRQDEIGIYLQHRNLAQHKSIVLQEMEPIYKQTKSTQQKEKKWTVKRKRLLKRKTFKTF